MIDPIFVYRSIYVQKHRTRISKEGISTTTREDEIVERERRVLQRVRFVYSIWI